MKKKPSGTISAKVLQNKIRSVRAEITETDNALYELHERRERMQTRLETFLELLRDVEPERADDEAARVVPSAAKTLTDAAVEYLIQHPGARPAEVVDALIKNVNTTAKDPRKNLFQTLLNLKNRGRITDAPEGGLKVAGNGTAPNQ